MADPDQITALYEQNRLQALQDYEVLDTLPERGYEDITELAAFICGAPISLISLVDKDRQWFKSAYGIGASETPRSQSFCANTLVDARTLIVEDATTDARFKDNPLVLGDPNIRFYAGAPIIEKSGHVLGTVCVIDTRPRVLSDQQISALEALARQVMVLLDQRKTIARLKEASELASVADQTVLANEQRLQGLFNSIPALAWTADVHGSITWFNQRWYDYTGSAPRAMEGWNWQSVHDPALLPIVMERWTAAVKSQQPFEMIFPLRGADGTFRSFLTRVSPVRDEAGSVLEWVGTNTEIDELQTTRLALERSEAGLNQVMSATSDAVVSVNRDWVITYLNPMAEQLYGASKDLVGRNLWAAFPEAVYPGSPFVENYERAMNEGIAGCLETDYPEPLNFFIGLEVYPTTDGIVTFSRDVTRLKKAAAAILQNEKLAAVGRLASSIAHEINNPLESVTNLVYLARITADPAQLDQYLASAEHELQRVSAITSQTLHFYKQTTRPRPIDAADLFRETVQIYQGRLINSSVRVENRHRPAPPTLCFEGEIRQVLSNLIVNAIDSMHGTGGALKLRSRQAIDWKTGEPGLALTIADNGVGMSPQVRRQIFEAFYSTKGPAGAGLGLWVSKEIVDRHHGSLRVRSSDRIGRHGTVFILFLPIMKTSQPTPQPIPSANPIAQPAPVTY